MSANITKSNNTNENKTYKNMKKNVQRINESQLRAIVAESVKKVLNEGFVPPREFIQQVAKEYAEYYKGDAFRTAEGVLILAFDIADQCGVPPYKMIQTMKENES